MLEKSKLMELDEARFEGNDRLCLAWWRLRCCLCDPIAGEKPVGYDELPYYMPPPRFPFQRRRRTKLQYIQPITEASEYIVGRAAPSRFGWVYIYGKPENEWLTYYLRWHLPV